MKQAEKGIPQLHDLRAPALGCASRGTFVCAVGSAVAPCQAWMPWTGNNETGLAYVHSAEEGFKHSSIHWESISTYIQVSAQALGTSRSRVTGTDAISLRWGKQLASCGSMIIAAACISSPNVMPERCSDTTESMNTQAARDRRALWLGPSSPVGEGAACAAGLAAASGFLGSLGLRRDLGSLTCKSSSGSALSRAPTAVHHSNTEQRAKTACI